MFIGEIARGEFPHHAEYFARGLKRACGAGARDVG